MQRSSVVGVVALVLGAWAVTHAQTGPAAGAWKPGAGAGTPPSPAVVNGVVQPSGQKMRAGVGYYTEAQAERGRLVFEQACSYCHSVDPKKAPTFTSGGQLASGFRAIAEKRYNNKPLNPSVYYYWRRILLEPGDNIDRVSTADKLDAMAYLLQQNGFPPGPQELVDDPEAMKGMYLDPGPGFEWLFNGKDFTGWKFLRGALCAPKPEGCGETSPFPELSVKNGEMVAAGKTHVMVYTERKFKSYTLQFDWRFAGEWDDLPELFPGNNGVLFFMDIERQWPTKYALVDGRWYDFMHIQSPGLALKQTYDDDARRRAIRRPTDWQEVEIIASNGGLKAYLNGVLISTVEEGQLTEASPIGFQSQVQPFRWRHLRIKVEE